MATRQLSRRDHSSERKSGAGATRYHSADDHDPIKRKIGHSTFPPISAGGRSVRGSFFFPQNVEEATKTFNAATLNGVRPIDRYKDEKKDIYYVLVKMDLENVKDMLMQSKKLNSQVRDYVCKNADRAFERLEKEEQKREGSGTNLN